MDIDRFAQTIEERDTTFIDGDVLERLQNAIKGRTVRPVPTFSTARGDHTQRGYDLKDPEVHVSMLKMHGVMDHLYVVYTYTYDENALDSEQVQSVLVTEHQDVANDELYSYLVKR